MSRRSAFRNITPLNLLLCGIVILMVRYSLLPFLGVHVEYTLPSAKALVSSRAARTSEPAAPSPAEFTMISNLNLFHPERIIPAEKKVEEQSALTRPEVILYGTLISGDLRLAYVEDAKAPRNSPGRGKRQIAMKIGDLLSGFTLKEIEEDKIVLAKGEDKMTVRVLDPRNRKAHPPIAAQPHSVGVAPAAASLAPPQTPARPSVESLTKPVAPPTKRASNIPAKEERALDFFRRLPPQGQQSK